MLNDADVSRFRHVYVFVGKTDPSIQKITPEKTL